MQQLQPHVKDLGGGFLVRRLLPSLQRRAVGPFVFFDHFGPLRSQPQDNHDVRPHPHIGLATVTYLFDGAMMHRDSTGAVQRIEPGAANWMIAGRGVVHSERTPDDWRGRARTSHGLQLWVALPEAEEACEPSFTHVPAEAIPQADVPGVALRVLVGRAFGVASPVPVCSPTLYLDMRFQPGATLELPGDLAEEVALYAVEGTLQVGEQTLPSHVLAPLEPGRTVRLRALEAVRAVLVGGQPLGTRWIWWNFVASRKESIVQAAQQWADQPNATFPAVPGEVEFIPLPERRFAG